MSKLQDESYPTEKYVNDMVVSTTSDDSEPEIVKDWDDKEEARVRRKIDWILIPILALAFFALQVDRGNISAALTSTITTDLHINTNQINVGTQLLSAGIVLTEIPSNIVLQRVGPQYWLSMQLFAWGLVATFQAFVKNYPSYLVTRLLLGMLEGGFIPGALYYLSTWYKKDETSFRITLFFFGQMFSGATSSLISAGLLTLSGKGGLSGWQWIFLVEGLITLFAGVVFFLLLPPKAGNGEPLLGRGRWSYFTPRETHIIRNRVLLDDPNKTHANIHITGRDIWNTVKQPRTLQHFFITLVAMSGFQGISQYTPSMIKSSGFGAIQANALYSVPVYCSMVWVIIMSYFSDKTSHRGPFVLLTITWNVISYACLRVMPYHSTKWHKYAVLTMANFTYASMHVLNVGWLSYNCKTPQERSISMALVVMAANCAGISGSQVFRTQDAPKYIKALTACVALAAASWAQTLALGLQYYFINKKNTKKSVGNV